MHTKIDTFALLEERIESLISHLEKVHRANDELRQQNLKLTGRVDKLEAELHAMTEKEDQVRDRLQNIVKKIDTMEEVLAGQAAAE